MTPMRSHTFFALCGRVTPMGCHDFHELNLFEILTFSQVVCCYYISVWVSKFIYMAGPCRGHHWYEMISNNLFWQQRSNITRIPLQAQPHDLWLAWKHSKQELVTYAALCICSLTSTCCVLRIILSRHPLVANCTSSFDLPFWIWHLYQHVLSNSKSALVTFPQKGFN